MPFDVSDNDLNAQISQDEWLERSRYWLAEYEASLSKRKRRERPKEPLVLLGHGLNIKVYKGRLIIRDGATHFPSEPREFAFFKGSLELPLRIVVIDGSGSITLDAIDWLQEQNIPLIRIRFDGSQISVMSPSGYSAEPSKVFWQIETRDNPEERLKFAIETTRKKLEASVVTLRDYIPEGRFRDAALIASKDCLQFIEGGKVQSTSELLGQEGKAASHYWRAWQSVPMQWKSESRFPIPDEWRTYLSRSSLNTGLKRKNLRASHPINALLNYAYTVLLSQKRIEAIVAGYDPMIGILHDQRHYLKDSTPSFALDLMEPFRPVVDRAVLKLIQERTFSGADFDLQSDGVVRVNPNLIKVVTRDLI
ncbi:CRISPR-associated endonuclease Cas1 [Ponticaulis sp.]|uniref:CRISPR-associated endonuclease Cas1 n=1 Tax=Ponticaulis sp. TaxID=2020902 RepID=UPI000B70BBCB|nr:CRISPR-associated endonuclease Cas1 [Ponticaulis sp.]MAI89048.1 CRISPR-associated endonuclease Cas1 [Ponticaulis sp.]OUY01728.1 MAG: CRISPR-associated endonuclease Cas1 [Hyphomonadaceae bacterium TMED5]